MDLQDREEGWLGFTRMRVSKPTLAAVEATASRAASRWPSGVTSALPPRTPCSAASSGGSAFPLVDGGTQRLPRLVGRGRALDMVLTGRAVEAEEAHDWGLADRVVDPGGAREAAVDLDETIAEFPQETVRTDRAALYDGIGESLERGLQIEGLHGRRVLDVARSGADRFAAGEGRHGEGVADSPD